MHDGDAARIAEWLTALASQRRQSPHTVAAYGRELTRLCALAEGTPLAALDGHRIRQFVVRLHAQGLSPRSLARALSAWRSHFGWLARRGDITHNPVEGVRPPRAPRPLPRVLSPDEASALLAAPADPDEETAVGARDRALFELAYSSGLRLAELVGLNLDCLPDVAGGEVRVLGKRNKVRIVPVGAPARDAVAAWAARRGELALPDEPALFVGARGRRIAPRVVQLQLDRLARRQGLLAHVHPHMLRHSFASHVLQSSGDLRAVQEMLGHASIASTQVYTHLDFQHLARTYDAAHPRARRAAESSGPADGAATSD